MKKLQINYTNVLQSRKLLKIGVPAWSADCTQEKEQGGSFWQHKWIKHEWNNDYDAKDYQKFLDREKDTLPCWSFGRLIEIYDIIINLFPGMDLRLSDMKVGEHNESYIEKLVYLFECAAEDGMIDFKELEE